jgi:hypothetical protein
MHLGREDVLIEGAVVIQLEKRSGLRLLVSANQCEAMVASLLFENQPL